MGVVVGSREQAAEYAEQVRKNEKLLAEMLVAALAVIVVVAAAVGYAFSVGAF